MDAVKANSDPTVLKLLTDAGVSHFDCASLPEIALIDAVAPDATKYFMIPTRLREAARSVLEQLPFRLRLIDVGGGYPKSFPGFIVPEMETYFKAVSESVATLPLADNAEVLGEPGRALAAPGMSAVVEVVLRKDHRLYINDGMYGVFWALRFDGHDRFPVRTYRDGSPLDGKMMEFQVNGPTCDCMDMLPGLVPLPVDVRPGDYLEFSKIGACSISGRTDYNGFYSDRIVPITSPAERPPAVKEDV